MNFQENLLIRNLGKIKPCLKLDLRPFHHFASSIPPLQNAISEERVFQNLAPSLDGPPWRLRENPNHMECASARVHVLIRGYLVACTRALQVGGIFANSGSSRQAPAHRRSLLPFGVRSSVRLKDIHHPVQQQKTGAKRLSISSLSTTVKATKKTKYSPSATLPRLFFLFNDCRFFARSGFPTIQREKGRGRFRRQTILYKMQPLVSNEDFHFRPI